MNKLKYLEGLRGIAALVVVLSHFKNVCFLPQQELLYSSINGLGIPWIAKAFTTNFLNKLVDGELAVWIFWVLSAYVISIPFCKKNQGFSRKLMASFSKRYFRLLIPVLASVIIAYLLLQFGLMYHLRLARLPGMEYAQEALNSFFPFNANFSRALWSAFYETFFAFQLSSSYNPVLWTIQYEFLGSLFTFGMIGVLRHFPTRFILKIIIFLLLFKLQLLWLCAFVVGHILCDYDYSEEDSRWVKSTKRIEENIHSFKIPVFLLSLAIISLGENVMDFFSISFHAQKLALSVAIVYFCLRNKYYIKFFASKIPVWLGKISFGLYLIHLPLICSLTSYLILINPGLNGKIFASVITLIISLVAAHFFTKYIDDTSIRYANRIGNYFANKGRYNVEAKRSKFQVPSDQ
jgi:peptidoglycan/LPS O-acetylase OafA/YrhL